MNQDVHRLYIEGLRAFNHPTCYSSEDPVSLSQPLSLGNSQTSEYPKMSSTAQSKRRPKDMKERGFPSFPSPRYNTTLLQPDHFELYVDALFPHPPTSDPKSKISKSRAVTNASRATVEYSKLSIALTKQLASKLDPVTSLEWIHTHLFPDSALPAAYNTETIRQSASWVLGAEKFCHSLTLQTEEGVACWLDDLAQDIAEKFHIHETAPRSFDPYSKDTPLDDGHLQRKPDTVLLDTALQDSCQVGDHINWRQPHALVETTKSTGVAAEQSVLTQLITKASLILECQPYRRFVCGLGFVGTSDPNKFSYIFTLIDRSGVTVTAPNRVDGYGALALGRIVFAMRYADPVAIGIDTTMRIDPTTYDVTEIDVQDSILGLKTFKVIREIYRPIVPFGRGTRVYIVQEVDDGPLYILKDSWLHASHNISEIDQLRKIQERLNANSSDKETFKHTCPQIYVGQELLDNTAHRRGALPNPPSPRIHRRIVVGPIGDPITMYRSRKELIRCFIHIIDVLEYLETRCDVIHGDISPFNLVIVRVPALTPNSGLAAADGVTEDIESFGSPIDYDYSRKRGQGNTHVSGTPPYMSIEALRSVAHENVFEHTAAHDLESLFYTLLALCLYTSPGGVILPTSAPMNGWFKNIELSAIARFKVANFGSVDAEVLRHIPDYWKPFKPYLKKLSLATWRQAPTMTEASNRATHAAYREILEQALQDKAVINETPTPYASVPPHKRSRSSKNNVLSRHNKVQVLDAGVHPINNYQATG